MRLVRASPETIDEAARMLRAGVLVAFPTETVYGLGADATNGLAAARIFEAKGRPRFNPLIAHVPSVADIAGLATLTPLARRLGEAFWPGPMTLVLPKAPGSPIADLVTAGLDTVAIRIPSHPVAQALLKATGRPVAAPSANRSGHVSATTAAHVAADLGASVGLILDGGRTEHGLESTIIDATGDIPLLLRPGSITADAIRAATGHAPVRPQLDAHRPSAPGQLESHYAPRAAVRLDATSVEDGEAVLAFGPLVPSHTGALFNLSPTGDLVEAAANLFAALRDLDRSGTRAIAVMPIPSGGLGDAINDRLRRAAAPRP